MEESKQIQKAGANATQFQAQTVNFYEGITEEKAKEIFWQQNDLAMQEYSQEAIKTANERVGKLEAQLLPRISQLENALPAFADPAFQMLLKKAQLSAAASEREDDYKLLSELLVCHIQKGNDRKNRAGIKQAIQIVDDIDNEALCGLTIFHAIDHFFPVEGMIKPGLKILDDLFSKLLYLDLPLGKSWIDHLDLLGAVRATSFSTFSRLEDLYAKTLSGYVCAGIRVESDEFYKALQILKQEHINLNILVPNECLDGYARIAIINAAYIDELYKININGKRMLSDSEKKALRNIMNLYTTDNTLINQAKSNFKELWDSFQSLHKIRIWWSSIPMGFEITQSGIVLAHTNAKRCDPSLPDLI